MCYHNSVAPAAKSPGVLARAAHACRSVQDEIREANAIPRLLDLLRSCMDSSSLVVTVVKALSVLAHGNHMNMETIYRLNGVPLLLEMLAPKVGPVCNAAAADLIRVLCSNELCQQNILRNQGLSVRPAPPAPLRCPVSTSIPERPPGGQKKARSSVRLPVLSVPALCD